MCKIKLLDTKIILQTRFENAALHTAIVLDILSHDHELSIVEQKIRQKLIHRTIK